MYHLQHYLDMMNDPHRMGPLDAAIRSMVQPGDVVLDLGAGTGVLSFIALDAGAGHVFAVERSAAIEVARRVARANGFSDRITFIEADARDVVPPRRVDGMIADIRGTLPLLEDNIELFQSVRARWLKPAGYTIPLADELHVAPVAARAPHARITGWMLPRPEAHYDAAAQLAANALTRAELRPDDVLAASQPLGSVCYDGMTPRRMALETSFVIERASDLTGLGVWFRGELTPQIVFDTSPFSPPTIYAQAFFPLSQARPVNAGETINVQLVVHRTAPESIWTWRVRSAGKSPWEEDHSTFKGTLLNGETISWLAGSKCPTLSPEGAAARRVLDAIDGATTARALALQLKTAFPARFASEDDALPAVMKLLGQYSSP